jgi:DNA-binding IscR family transcriptional regulator
LGSWTFVTNHGAVLAYIAANNKARAIDIARELGITERSVRRIIANLASAGYVKIAKDGRENAYSLDQDRPLRRTEVRDIKVRELLQCLTSHPS